jgi:hypothetical protein
MQKDGGRREDGRERGGDGAQGGEEGCERGGAQGGRGLRKREEEQDTTWVSADMQHVHE